MSTPPASTDGSERALRPDHALPPVEPPSAGFIVQLFVIPAVIVAIIVAVWLLFNWLAHMGADPKAYVAALQRNNAARWQAAVNLANALRDPRYETIKQDPEIARSLGAILSKEAAAHPEAGAPKESLELRSYLASALGEFHVPDALPPLLEASNTERNPDELPVRFAALRAINVYLAADANQRERGSADVLRTLIDASKHDKPLIRSTAAFALGAARTDAALDRLEQMMTDPDIDVRYNAATMLGLAGRATSVPILVEMLNPDQSAALKSESDAGARELKVAEILGGGLRATSALIQQHPEAGVPELRAAVERLNTADVPKPAQRLAADVLEKWPAMKP